MARPRSEDKRNAILQAAIDVMAAQGIAAPTAAIARRAGVAEGSLFTYFPTKDALLNELYLALKQELGGVMMATFPARDSIRARTRHIWSQYIAWGVAHPGKRKVIAQLGMSARISEHSKSVAMQAFGGINGMMEESLAQGVLRDQPPAFIAALMGTLGELTMDFITQFPDEAARYEILGFEAFWNAVVQK